MTVKRIYSLLALLVLGLSGCAVTDFDRSADFSKYRTYAWGKSEVDVSNPLYDSDLIDKRIQSAVDDEFARRGIIQTNQDPDVIVRFHTFTEEKKRMNSSMYPYSYRFYPFGFYPFFGWAYAYPYPWMNQPAVSEYTEGTLILDILDQDTGELVWRGSVSGNVEDTSDLRKQIDKGIRAIMKKYPVSPGEPLKFGGDPNTVS